MAADPIVARGLAEAFLAGPWSAPSLAARGRRALGSGGRWLRSLARRVVLAIAERPGDASEIADRILADEGFRRACRRASPPLRIHRWLVAEPAMAPAPGAPSTWEPLELPTAGDLGLWLGLTAGELLWFADPHGLERASRPGPLRHYRYRWIAKSSGAYRLVEAPRPRLKALQRRLLRELIDVAPTHEAAHGFRRGRSVASFVRPHAGQEAVLKIDLRDFFASIRAARIHAIYRTMGYPDEVSRLLAGLCTNCVPPDVWIEAPPPESPEHARLRWQARRLYVAAHLPAGAPTSPALANLCAFGLDVRLAAAAEAVGARYTRYADDLAFSGDGDFARRATRFSALVSRIAAEEGFQVHQEKTRLMRRGVRQSLAGVVVNEHPNVPRAEYDRLKAIVTNCERTGPRAQNRAGLADFRAHLLGRVSWLASLNPARAGRLRERVLGLDWSGSARG